MPENFPSAQKTLEALAYYLKNGEITQERVQQLFPTSNQVTQNENRITVQRVLYYVGGIIVLMGIAVYIGQYWATMDLLTRAIVTLVPAMSAYALGYYFHYRKGTADISHVFFIIAIVLFPLGIGTSLNTMGIKATTSGGITINAAVLFLVYFISSYTLKSLLFLPFAIIAASTLFLSSTTYLAAGRPVFAHYDHYRMIILGLSYITFGYYLSKKLENGIPKALTFFGLIFFLLATFLLQGTLSNPSLVWQLIFPGILVIIYYLSMKIQNKIYLFSATLFTFGEIIKITYEHFANTIGWPLSLIIAGLAIIGCGFISFHLGQRFEQRKSAPASN